MLTALRAANLSLGILNIDCCCLEQRKWNVTQRLWFFFPNVYGFSTFIGWCIQYIKKYICLFWWHQIVFPVLFSLFVWFKCEYLPLISTLFVLDCSQYVATDKKDTIKLICWSSLLFWKVVTSDFFCFRRLVGGFKHLTLAIALSNLRLMETPSIKYYLQPSNILLWETTE